ncbi:MAG: DUF5689 domain-containing protein [Bacteroidales bacterium]|nr:DUF5689 domain-containing protein [Bacteroidales bacterium]
MKNKSLNISWMVLLLATTTLMSCFKKPTEPPIRPIPVGKIYTLEEVFNKGTNYTFDTIASVFCTVTADESNGNLYKQVFVQDGETAMQLVFTEGSNFKIGDSIRIYLNGLTVYNYNGIMQLRTIQPDSNIVVIANHRYIQPAPVTISQVTSGQFTGRLVQLMDVEFQDFELGSTFADKTNLLTENHTLQDCDGKTIIVRTSGYASFADAQLPRGKGSMVAIASVYNSTYQMIVRSFVEVAMDSVRCDGTWGPNFLFKESFASDQGDFTTKNLVGSQVWYYASSYSCMVMSGYQAPDYFNNDDWLISPSIDLSVITMDHVNLSFEHAARYGSAYPTHLTVWVSTNYDGTNLNEEDWTQVNVPTYPSGSDWSFVQSGAINLDQFVGATNFHFALRYTSTPSACATWEVKNAVIILSE